MAVKLEYVEGLGICAVQSHDKGVDLCAKEKDVAGDLGRCPGHGADEVGLEGRDGCEASDEVGDGDLPDHAACSVVEGGEGAVPGRKVSNVVGDDGRGADANGV